MMYTTLLYFLVVIFVLSTSSDTGRPLLGAVPFFTVCLGLLYAYARLCALGFRDIGGSSQAYFKTEKRLSIFAVLVFTGLVYVLDLNIYLGRLPFADSLPVLQNLGGLVVFFLLLIIMWQRARPAYEQVFNRSYSASAFILSNIKANLPVILPWLILSLVFDVMALLPLPQLHKILASPWGDLVLFMVFVVFLVLFFPPLIRRLWGCRPMPEGQLRSRIEDFCQGQGFSSEILMWPLFEGQVLTAGIMGILPRFRYLLITPALLAALNREELEAVVSHELGHVKRMHLVLYVALFLGFSVVAGVLAEPLPHVLLAGDFFYQILRATDIQPDTLLAVFGALPLLVLLLVYFRFVFGYFIRNFERQADLFVFSTQGTGRALVGAFEKIAWLSGNSRDQKSWHHFGIAERVEMLEHCEKDRSLVRRHDRKVYMSLVIYFVIIAAITWGNGSLDTSTLVQGAEIRYAESVLMDKAKKDPENSLWYLLLGDLLKVRELEQRAINAYGRALEISPANAEVNNNLAWLLLTARDRSLRDQQRALTLARAAALLKEEGYILDTLATAFWANGFLEEALLVEVRAMKADPANSAYYRSQLERFNSSSWEKKP
ncbi:MAG: peptidase M48 Ste24p [Desulfobulbus propionicus]|nr:MAG: peptidase M48 Ste24p [Desulfobulbus propionicus]